MIKPSVHMALSVQLVPQLLLVCISCCALKPTNPHVVVSPSRKRSIISQIVDDDLKSQRRYNDATSNRMTRREKLRLHSDEK